MKSQKIRFILAIVIAALTGYILGITKIDYSIKNFKPDIQFSSKEPPSSTMNLDFSQFWIVLDKLEESYYDKDAIDPQAILNGAISGMVESLDDPYTVYLPPKQNNDFKDGLAGKFEGIGAELGLKDKQIIIVAPLDGSPAKKSGVRAGDAIIKVNDEITFGWTIAQAVDMIRGPKGTKVQLTVVREGEQEPVEINITRDTITINSLTTYTKPIKDIESVNKTPILNNNLNQKIVYLRLSQFGDTTNSEWLKVSNDVASQLNSDKSIKGIVLDLRSNPGGYLTDAVFITSEFVRNGNAVLQEDKNGDQTPFPVSGKGLLYDIPLVVLINKGSASASEIVAGALRDHNRAKLIGETSFGKGTIQTAEDFGGGAGLHVTIAKWLTPKGTWVGNGKSGSGLIPDIEVEINKNNPEQDIQLERAIEELVK